MTVLAAADAATDATAIASLTLPSADKAFGWAAASSRRRRLRMFLFQEQNKISWGPRHMHCCESRNTSAAQISFVGSRIVSASEKDAQLAQKLGQLQPLIAVFPQECVGQLASFGPT